MSWLIRLWHRLTFPRQLRKLREERRRIRNLALHPPEANKHRRCAYWGIGDADPDSQRVWMNYDEASRFVDTQLAQMREMHRKAKIGPTKVCYFDLGE